MTQTKRNKTTKNTERYEHMKNNRENQGLNEAYSSNDLLLKEFDQAWNHYRHIEDQRSKTMNYFYTIVLGITVLFVNYFKDKNLQLSYVACIGISMLLLLVFIYTFFAYTSVRKASKVLNHYENVMEIIRKLYYKDERSLKLLYVRKTLRKSKISKLFSVQSTSESTLLGTMLVILIIEILIYMFFFQITNSSTQLKNFLFLNFIIIAMIFVIIIHDLFGKKK